MSTQNHIDENTDLKNISYLAGLLNADFINNTQTENETWEDCSKHKQNRLYSGVSLEKADKNAKMANKETIIHVNNFGDSYPAQHGLDSVTYANKLSQKRFTEVTNPKANTIMGVKIWCDKLANFFKEDPDHDGLWTVTVSYPENIPFAVKVLLAYHNFQVIKSGYATNRNIGDISGYIFAQLKDGKNWLDNQPLITIQSEHEAYYQQHLAINKARLRHNRQVAKINQSVQKLRAITTYKALITEVKALNMPQRYH